MQADELKVGVVDEAAPEPMSFGEVLRLPAMRRLWYAQIVSTFGDFIALFAVIGELTFKLHATGAQITAVQFAYILPLAVLGVVSGVFIDRWPMKPTLVASDLMRSGLVLLLLVANQLWQYYAILAAISVLSSFFAPAQTVAVRAVVPVHGLRSANSLMQQVFMSMRIIGPSMAAFLVAKLGSKFCYWADSASFVASGCLIAGLALQRDAVEPKPLRLATIWADMREALSFIFHHARLLFVILALASGMFVLGCFYPLIALYVRDALHGDTAMYGVVSAMLGVGLLSGANVVIWVGKRVGDDAFVYAGLAGIGCGLMVLAAVATEWTSILGVLLMGFAAAGVVVPANTMIQTESPGAMVGRVQATVMSLVFTAQILGLLATGTLSHVMGVREIVGLCAVLMLGLMLAGKVWMEPGRG